MSLLHELRKVSTFKRENFSEDHSKFTEVANQIKDLGCFYEQDYKVTSSIGKGQYADMWWIGIHNYDFYKNMYNITSKHSVGASKGYYVVYLFNDDKKKLYLTINQAASDISFKKNSEKKTMVLNINDFLRTLFPMRKNYLTNISGKLSDKNISKARDYEIGTIVAIEYDLFNEEISDEVFKRDLRNILNDLETMMDFILEHKIYEFDSNVINFKDRLIYSGEYSIDIDELKEDNNYLSDVLKETKILSDEEINIYNSRKPKYPQGDTKSKRIVTIPALAKHVLKQNDFKCMVDENHKWFDNKKGENYVEAHHLVPVKHQDKFGDFCLDQEMNIVSVCPVCHAAIHYGNTKVRLEKLQILYENSKMKDYLESNKIVKDFYEFYDLFYK